MNILITGGAGYIGSVLIRKLLKENHYVTVIDNLTFGGESLIGLLNHGHFKFEKLDIQDSKKISALIKRNSFDAVIHLAAIVGDPACSEQPELARKVNFDSSLNLLDCAVRCGVDRFIFASTCSNYGKMADNKGYVDENSSLSPVSLYAKLKVKFEEIILHEIERKGSFCPTILRFSTVYGVSPRMRFDLTVNEFTKELSLGRELEVFGGQFWRPYCHVSDFASAIMLVLNSEKEKVAYDVFNVGDTIENYTKKMLIEQIKDVIPEATVRYVKKEEDPRDYRVSFEKIKVELGFNISKTVPDGIAEINNMILNGFFMDIDDKRYRNI